MGFWTPGFTLEAMEQATIEEAMRFYRNNKTQTAQSLDIAVRTLDSKLEKYAIDRANRENRKNRDNAERKEFLDRQRGHFQDLSISNQTTTGSVPSNDDSSAGLLLEPTAEVGAKSKVSLSERAAVQEVLPRQATKSGAKKAG